MHPLLDPSNPTAAYCKIKYAVVQVILHPEEEGEKLMIETGVSVLHISVTLQKWTADHGS